MAEGAGDTLLVQFARVPCPGAVKTRLQPTLSPGEACAVHEALLRWTCHSLLQSGLGPVELWLDRDLPHPAITDCLAAGARGPQLQRGADLGERMYRALAHALARHPRVLLVGSDCPGLDAAYLARAAEALERSDCVLGPALDGGYVLIGARRIAPACLEGIDWGSDRAYRQTVAGLEGAGLSWQALPPRRDIDRPGDLPYWEAVRRAGRGAPAAPEVEPPPRPC